MWKKARVRSLDLEGTAFGDVQATLRLVLAALEVILVTRADDGGVTHGLFEQPVEEALLLTSLRDETMYRNFPSVSFFQIVSIRARPRFSQKNPSSNPHPNFPTNFDGSQLPKIQQTRQRNPSHPSSSERSIGRTIRSIHRSGRSPVDPGVDRERRRTHRVASRHPSSHHPYPAAHPRQNVTDRARSMAVPRSSSLSRFPHAHRASHRFGIVRVEKTHLARRLLGGNLSGTTALGVRGGDDDSGGAHGKHVFGFVFAGFVRSREVTPSLGSARLHPPRAGASFGVVRRRFPR